jgi:alpha-tubulin suppressor-like RCC1 family protein
MSLNKYRVKQMALGKWHTLCLTFNGKIFTWGRNHRGQLGRGFVSEMETEPGLALDINSDHDHGLKISAGMLHSAAIIRVEIIDQFLILFSLTSGQKKRQQRE